MVYTKKISHILFNKNLNIISREFRFQMVYRCLEFVMKWTLIYIGELMRRSSQSILCNTTSIFNALTSFLSKVSIKLELLSQPFVFLNET